MYFFMCVYNLASFSNSDHCACYEIICGIHQEATHDLWIIRPLPTTSSPQNLHPRGQHSVSFGSPWRIQQHFNKLGLLLHHFSTWISLCHWSWSSSTFPCANFDWGRCSTYPPTCSQKDVARTVIAHFATSEELQILHCHGGCGSRDSREPSLHSYSRQIRPFGLVWGLGVG